MPQACTRMRTCPAPGFGISRSTISKFAPGFGTCATFIFAIEALRSLFWIHAQKLDVRHMKTGTYCGAAEWARAEQDCAEIGKKFCRDFRGDAQALGLTRARLPRTMRHHFEQGSVRTWGEKFCACPPAQNVVQKRRKGEYKAGPPCPQTRHSRNPYRITWMPSAPFLARYCWTTMR